MKLELHDNSTTEEVKTQFNSLFEYLKLEFFNSSHGLHEGSMKSDMIVSDVYLKDLTAKVIEGEIDCDTSMRVSDIEIQFKEKFDLNVQVFRRTGKLWLETSMTDSWTLYDQNEHGKLFSQHEE